MMPNRPPVEVCRKVIVPFVIALTTACTLQAATLVLHLPFDGNLEPAVGKELGVPAANGTPTFVEGRHGQAIALTDGCSLVEKLPPAIRKGEFSIALWIKPLWFYSDHLPHTILEVPTDPKKQDNVGWAPGQFVLKKGWSETISPDNMYGVVDPDLAKMHLRPNRWTHVVMVFSVTGGFSATYFDGEGWRRPEKLETPEGYGDTLWLGAAAGGKTNFGEYVLDDLKIFDGVLTPEEIPGVAGAEFPPPRDLLSLGNTCDPAKAEETPHVTWAKPLAGGRLRVLCLTEGRRAREIVELMQRIDIDPVVVTTPTPEAHILKNPDLFRRVGNRIEEVLKGGKVDGILIAAHGWNLLPESTRAEVLKAVRAGAGLLFIDPRCILQQPGGGRILVGHGVYAGWAEQPEGKEIDALVSRPERTDEEFLTRGIPWRDLSCFGPTLARRPPENLFRGGRVEKGRILLYGIFTGGVYSSGCVTPSLVYAGPIGFNEFEYDYAVGAAARALLWACGRDSAVRVRQVLCGDPHTTITAGSNAPWQVDLTNSGTAETRVRLLLTVRKDGPEPPFEYAQDVALKPGETRISVPWKASVVGTVFADVRIQRDGGTLDWGTGVAAVGRAFPRLFEVTADQDSYTDTEAPLLSFAFAKRNYSDKAETAELRWRLYDAWGRVIRRGTRSLVTPGSDDAVGEDRLRLEPLTETGLAFTLYLDLGPAGQVTDQHSLILRRKPGPVDDYLFTSWQGGGGQAGDSLAALVMRDRYGMDCGGVATHRPLRDPDERVLFLMQMDWLSRHNLRSWIYATHIGGNIDAEQIRRPDLADPAYLAGLDARLNEVARVANPYSPLYYSLGDETKLGPPDARASGYEQEEFRRWLRKRYGTLEVLNKAWSTTYKAWSEIAIPPPEEMKQGKTVPELESFRETLYANAIAVGTDGARRVAADALVGVEGIFGLTNAWTGQDYWKMTRAGTFMGQYACGMEMNMVRSFQKPGDLLGAWYNYNKLDREYSLYGPWHMLLRGARNFMWYTTLEGSQYSALNPDFSAFDQFAWTNEELQPLLNGLGKLVVGLKRDDLGVAVLHDQRNLDRCSPQFHSMLMTSTLLEDLGVQHEFVHGEQVMTGALATRGVKVLFLPGQFHMDMPVADAVRRFVEGGGCAIADVLPADANGARRYDKRPLDDLFADSATLKGAMPPATDADCAAWATRVKSVGKGKTLLYGNYPATYGRDRLRPRGDFMRRVVNEFLTGAGVRQGVTVRAADGSFQPLTVVTYHCGNTLYVGYQREYGVVDQAPRPFVFSVSDEAYTYDARTGEYLGRTKQVNRTIEVARGGLLAFLPGKVTGVRIDGLPAECAPGRVQELQLSIDAEGRPAEQGVFRVEVSPPGAKMRLNALSGKVRWTAGVAAYRLPVAWNDSPGKWLLTVTDIATGVRAEKPFTVLPPDGAAR